MDDRVRIYELARRMDIPNQDIIVALRELGYDIKSHSSTVDSNTVGLLISALNKKKQQDKAKPTKQSTKLAPKTIVTATPPPPVVKPRVLSRYRPVQPVTEPITGEETSTPADSVSIPIQPDNTHSTSAISSGTSNMGSPQIESTTAIHAPSTVVGTSQIPTAGTTTEPHVSETSAIPKVKTSSINHPPNTGHEHTEVINPTSTPASSTQVNQVNTLIQDLEPGQSLPEREHEEAVLPIDEELDRSSPEIGISFNKLSIGQSVKPAGQSMPVRVAAPSIRATPPRPPKVHRQTPTERHVQQQRKEEKAKPVAAAVVDVPKFVTLTGPLTVVELADRMGIAKEEVITKLFMKGAIRTVNQLVEFELAKELAREMEYEVSTEVIDNPVLYEEVEEQLSAEDQAALVQRPPVVTIMGHVDHGKTSLLDAIRQTKFLLTDSEAGGITQHIGAYHVEVPYEDGTMRQIVFLDTPGHEAFTAMRSRGAKVADIAILVVAADDGVMPQTVEAIDHAKAAGVTIIVAVNKVDKHGANPDRVLNQLMEHGLVSGQFGGQTVTVNVSAKKRTGLDELLGMILLVAEADLHDSLMANPDKPAHGVIIEAELSRGRGAVATALVESGTLREGDFIVAGSKSGRVRSLLDDRGNRVKAAGPSMPVEVSGLDEVPLAGERFEVVEDSQAAKLLVEQRKLADNSNRGYHVTLESLHDMLVAGEVKELNVIIKADVQGTAEAIAESVRKLSGSEVQVRVLRTASGDISENDVNLATSSNAIILGFNVQPDQNAARVREINGIDIRTYNTIYQITDDLEKAIQGLIEPVKQEVQIGTAEVRQIFKFGKNLMIAGCMVTSGKVVRGAIARIERNGQIFYDGKIETLKRFKDDAKEVAQGFECGISFEKLSDVQEGDKINVFAIQEIKKGS